MTTHFCTSWRDGGQNVGATSTLLPLVDGSRDGSRQGERGGILASAEANKLEVGVSLHSEESVEALLEAFQTHSSGKEAERPFLPFGQE